LDVDWLNSTNNASDVDVPVIPVSCCAKVGGCGDDTVFILPEEIDDGTYKVWTEVSLALWGT